MVQQELAVHEKMELHELLMFKSTCKTKSEAMSSLAAEGDLKSLLDRHAKQSANHVNDLRTLLGGMTIQ
ncbi:hypothetical protein [Paenibacillus xerothermodurans]|uniref:Spore coat protein n=1 Tax=Paenibacillus xerothermodurans TaxID=1977292 RepID=A0A2W1NBV7_PAEXE|nr:hypothetical protein [Paenibacillus xerothermodurans]PZE22149.1 spore coat protein [Paenibacillus xerothermodurans]